MNKGFPITKKEIEETVNEIKAKAAESIATGKPVLVAQQLNQPIPYCHTSGHSKIDDLVGANGNWYLEFRYNNFDNNVLFLLPDFCVDENEEAKNKALVELLDGDFQEEYLLGIFIGEHPNTPFIIKEYCLDKCIETLKTRLEILIDFEADFPYEEFQKEVDEFDKFRLAVFNISNNKHPELCYEDAVYSGWRKYINPEKKG